MKSILILLPLEHRDGRKLKPEFQQDLGMQFAVDCKWSRSGLADEELPLFAESSFSLASAEWCGGLCEGEEADEKNEGEEQVGEEEDEDVTLWPDQLKLSASHGRLCAQDVHSTVDHVRSI